MAKILFIVPDEQRLTFTKEVLVQYPDIEFEIGDPTTAVKIVKKYMAQGLEVVAARTGTASTLKDAQLDIAVVEIPLTSVDIIRSVHTAKLQGKNIALILHSGAILGLDYFAEVLGVNIRQYTVKFKQNMENEVLTAFADGADVVLGGFAVVRAATKLNLPYTYLKFGREGTLQAAQEALQILKALETEAAKRGFLGTILDYSLEGIVTIDKDNIITAFNPAAQKITKIKKADAIGQSVQLLLPQLGLDQISEKGIQELNSITRINNTRIICNKVPIIVKGKSFGAVASFQEIGKIQQMEAMIRQEVYARGHVAKFHFEDILGRSSVMSEAIALAKDYAATNSNILILGETGTGKEVFAQSIHNASSRSSGPFVAINCASLPSQILESELFGYVGGAFTGANKEGKPGLFEIAHQGTIFLDEIAEMDYINQGRLLRFLQEKTIMRLGSHKVIPVDVRIIAATNKNLEVYVRENKFRDDLYFRLNVLNLELPPLKERKQDIPIYIKHLLQELSANSGKNLMLTTDALLLLEEYPWPGNFREFRNIMERIAATCKTDTITKPLLEKMIGYNKTRRPAASPKELRWIEEIRSALEKAKGNYSVAAETLGINRTTLWRRMKKLNIEY